MFVVWVTIHRSLACPRKYWGCVNPTTTSGGLDRLYDPQSGAIEIEGVDLREIEADEWRSRITAVFQDFVRHELPLCDNISPLRIDDDLVDARPQRRQRGMYTPDEGLITAHGVDIARVPHEAWHARMAGAFQDFAPLEFRAITAVGLGDEPRSNDRPAAEHAVDRAGANDLVEQLRDGLDTQLGPTWQDGVDVSFGQWQKLALACGYMRADPLILVLDEATAALDAETEHALFERYAESARGERENGRITVLVSHRLSTVRMADSIVVLDVAGGRGRQPRGSGCARRHLRRPVCDPGGRVSLRP